VTCLKEMPDDRAVSRDRLRISGVASGLVTAGAFPAFQFPDAEYLVVDPVAVHRHQRGVGMIVVELPDRAAVSLDA
jgi:hypothetical protein